MLSFNDPTEPAVNVLIFIVNPFLQEFVHRSFDPLFRLGPLDNLTPILVLLVEVTRQIGVSRFVFGAFDVADLAPIFQAFTILWIHFDPEESECYLIIALRSHGAVTRGTLVYEA